MERIDKYFDKYKIIKHLCRIRARIALQRNKKHMLHLLTKNKDFDYHLNLPKNQENLTALEKKLNLILPPRKEWKKPNLRNRYSRGNQRINSLEYNELSLLLTIKHHSKKQPDKPYLIELNEFIEEIQGAINDPDYSIVKPKIIPQVKDPQKGKKGQCRPLAEFSLKDRIIIGITNKYLTDIFDKYYYRGSYAFRSSQNKKSFFHHDAVKSILDYRNKSTANHLWVVECDIAKFFDCVHHTVAKKQFNVFKRRYIKDNPGEFDHRAERIFLRYLDCYSFPKTVLIYNSDDKYWKRHKIQKGVFNWAEEKLNELDCFKNVRRARVGVPQGGALSCLISNLILDYADKKIEKLKDPMLRYVRFCDDMIIVHTHKEGCEKAKKTYYDSIKQLHLIPHEFHSGDLKNTRESFWNDSIKSKGPYMWSSYHAGAIPWFGFVGYEMHFDGHIRVRRRSLRAEKRKQRVVVNKVLNSISEKQRVPRRYVYESAANRMIGMSVGRVNMKNYNAIKPDLCWNKGFRLLNDNPQSRSQMKDLDRYRNKQLSRLVKKSDCDKKFKLNNDTVNKYAFTHIRGISDMDSAHIRQKLVEKGILNKRYKLHGDVYIDDPKLDLGLSSKYDTFRESIIEVLNNPIRERYISYYGKPFSYYYHVMERNSHKCPDSKIMGKEPQGAKDI